MSGSGVDSAGPLGLGLVGVGMWGRRLAAAMERAPGVRLAACFARDADARAAAARDLGCRAAPSWGALLEDAEVEAVVLATPNATHAPLTIDAAAHGRHVLVEKPIADTVEEATAMAHACREAGVVLQVGHEFRRTGAARAAAELVRSGALGRVVLAEANFSLPGRFPPGAWRSRRATLPGGPLTQLGVHHADTLQAWLGPALRVHASFAHLAADADIDDVAAVTLEHDSGARSVITTSYVSPKTYRIRLYGTDANLEYRTDMSLWPHAERMDAHTALTLERPDGSVDAVPFEPVDMLADELDAFARSVRTGTAPETGAQAGIDALKVVLAAILSTRDGRAHATSPDAPDDPGGGVEPDGPTRR